MLLNKLNSILLIHKIIRKIKYTVSSVGAQRNKVIFPKTDSFRDCAGIYYGAPTKQCILSIKEKKMIEEIYLDINQFIPPGILSGLCFFFLLITQKRSLHNYRIAHMVMGYDYLVYALITVAKYYIYDNLRYVALTISCLQAFLFTYALITLIDIIFFTKRKILKELLPIIGFTLALSILHFYTYKQSFQIDIYLFVIFYIILLIRYTILFRWLYSNYVALMDNLFSGEETHRLYWIQVSFYASLIIGILAIFYTVSSFMVVSLIFSIVVLLFYTAFRMRFINYAFMFQSIETAIMLKEPTLLQAEISESNKSDFALIRRIDTLIEERLLYKKADISINEIAAILDEKNRTVSETINRCCKINFKSYINEYRVKEAIRLFSEDKQNRLTIDAIAFNSGFANRVNFYRVFKKYKGCSHSDFRRQIMS